MITTLSASEEYLAHGEIKELVGEDYFLRNFEFEFFEHTAKVYCFGGGLLRQGSYK